MAQPAIRGRTRRLKPFNDTHARLMQRARVASGGQRQTRQRELVLWVARQMCPKAWRGVSS